MKKSLLLTALLAALTFNATASDFKRLSPELQAPVKEWVRDFDTAATATAQTRAIKARLADIPQPAAKITAPANGEQPAVDLYVYRPSKAEDKKLPVIYYTHGGGYIMGVARQSGTLLQSLADRHNVVAVSVEYRLATAAPFPADINDAYHGLSYVQKNAEIFGIDPNKTILLGDSAGGGLTARLALYARDKAELPQPIGQVLIYPMLDYRTGSVESLYPEDHTGEFVWTRASNRFGWATLRSGQSIEAGQMPYFSAATATNLKGLPPTYLVVGDLDLFVHEDLDYASRLIAGNVPTRVNVIPNFYHAAQDIAPDSPEAKSFTENLNQAIAEMLPR
ncbi:acetyl esterase/lipase [Cricetibacter osteomyelitidis]|uniref:Acetyl esterase/lipase n=1 Tax=Cricetibacter osteomyelitidis TaxID=1521931 RepID=A0A4R2SUK3_9PAST|nr:alpha/beta hydrolase [Cricetibacter osteomyelitidis]TCP92176.1 acetyl esterase/lipase [Cricetibacter osteomyelitidis]